MYFVTDERTRVSKGSTGIYMMNIGANKKHRVLKEQFPNFEEILHGAAFELEALSKQQQTILKTLANEQFGAIRDKWYHTDDYYAGVRWYDHLLDRILITRVYIELPSACNRDCEICSLPKYNGCFNCTYHQEQYGTSPDEQWYLGVIEQVASLAPQAIVFYGGNPFYEWEMTSELLAAMAPAMPPMSQKYILANVDCITDNKLAFCAHHGIEVICTLMEDDVDEICGNEKEMTQSEYANILHYAILYDDEASSNSADVNKFPSEEKVISESFSIKANHKRNIDNRIAHNLSLNELSYRASLFTSRCAGVLTVTKDQKLCFCPQCKFVIGEIEDVCITKVLAEKTESLTKLWLNNMLNVPECASCEYVIDCLDCRAVEYYINDNIMMKSFCEKL